MQYSKKLNIFRLLTPYLFLSLACLLAGGACKGSGHTTSGNTEAIPNSPDSGTEAIPNSPDSREEGHPTRLSSDQTIQELFEDDQSPLKVKITSKIHKGEGAAYRVILTNTTVKPVDLKHYSLNAFRVKDSSSSHFDVKSRKILKKNSDKEVLTDKDSTFKLCYWSKKNNKYLPSPSKKEKEDLLVSLNLLSTDKTRLARGESIECLIFVKNPGTFREATIKFIVTNDLDQISPKEVYSGEVKWVREATKDIYFDNDLEFIPAKATNKELKIGIGQGYTVEKKTDGTGNYQATFYVRVKNKSKKYLDLSELNICSNLERFKKSLRYSNQLSIDHKLLPGEYKDIVLFSHSNIYKNDVERPSLMKRILPNNWYKKYTLTLDFYISKDESKIYQPPGGMVLDPLFGVARRKEKVEDLGREIDKAQNTPRQHRPTETDVNAFFDLD